ncbi:hypothetical protein [Flavihumibacter petaseus]|uniref:Uncharacterized protein n=1 Tax=Flavihumibacter petaseus NBRC 106054 TaxID=1220578 RepID=A0A0E9N2F5_9BACT|nr:hypothetical protein [Flavihumibacter petaseus]GAO44019.1 hypothetical protein FPE01S_03_00580 [Flavihumibacter petaseus NBRC 106054]
MESNPTVTQGESLQSSYSYAAHLLINQKLSAMETKNALVAQGLDETSAVQVVEETLVQTKAAVKDQTKKDMLYGALWCVGGIVATAADIGFIFWGAIVFGGIQFFRGVANAT